MATTKNATYKVYNGTDWDTIYFATSAGQVGESETLKFLRPATHTVNGKSFYDTTNKKHQAIVLDGRDIKISTNTISGAHADIKNTNTIFDQFKDIYTKYQTLADNYGDVASNAAAADWVTANFLPLTGGDLSGDLKVNGDVLVTGELQVSSHIVMNRNNDDTIYCADVVTWNENEAGGFVRLDDNAKIAASFLPSYVDDVIEVHFWDSVIDGTEGYDGNVGDIVICDKVDGGSLEDTNMYTYQGKDTDSGDSVWVAAPLNSGVIYVNVDTNKVYRFSGSLLVEISSPLALGTTSSTAYRGDHGLIAYNHSQAAHAPTNAQPNVIETVKVAGTALTVSSKAVNITLSSFGITATKDELNFVDGVTSSIQTQLDAKASKQYVDTNFAKLPASTALNSGGIVTASNNGVSASGKTFETTLTNSDSKVPTSQAVTTAINALHKLFTGSTTPTGMKTGDVWLQYS